MRLNQKVYELYKLTPEEKKITNIDIRKSDNIMLVINGICTEVGIKLLFEKISMFDNIIKGYSILQNFGLAVDKDTHEGYLVDKKENRLSLHNVETGENIFFGNIRNPFVQMGDININEQTEERYISILKRAYSQVMDEEIKETENPENLEEQSDITKETNNNKSTETTPKNSELTIEQIENDFKDDGWNVYNIDNLRLFTKPDKTPILADGINELEFISSEKDAEAGVIYKFKNGQEDIDVLLNDDKIIILEPETVGE